MKIIGLIGGIGWPSTVYYYEYICKKANEHFGNRKAPEIIIYSMDMEAMESLQYSDKWEEAGQKLGKFAHSLELAGADFLMICSGTTNVPCKRVQESVSIPLISIVDPSAEAIKKQGLSKVGLMGTKVTMEHSFFSESLQSHGLDVIVPEPSERDDIHHIIYDELCYQKVLPESKKRYLEIIQSLRERGADCILLGCTEIPLLITQKDIDLPAFDITELHAQKAFELAIEE